MKTTFDILTILYKALDGSALKSAISGGIHKLSRPTGSKVEDVVINSLPITGGQLQRGTANVNIYVPDKETGHDRGPDTLRMATLSQIALTAIQDHYSQTYAFWVVNQHDFAEPETRTHYVNLRIDYRFFPTF